MPAADDGRLVDWNGTVRFRIPDGWTGRPEQVDGQDVGVFQPQVADGGILRVLSDRRTPRAGESAEAVLAEAALRFVRPDDPRAGDRTVERRADGATLAQLVMRTDEDGRAEAHYLWMLGVVRRGDAVMAMFSYALPAGQDGRDPFVTTLGRLDAAIRAADIA